MLPAESLRVVAAKYGRGVGNVGVGIGARHGPAVEVEHLAHLGAAGDELGAGRLQVVHDEEQPVGRVRVVQRRLRR